MNALVASWRMAASPAHVAAMPLQIACCRATRFKESHVGGKRETHAAANHQPAAPIARKAVRTSNIDLISHTITTPFN
ncbi:MAG TPA: hypothetical protein VK430_05655 [Xanthobacteraceae bacterium]|nr:hypothetical protein [Xanthobacteraceae bacterium]